MEVTLVFWLELPGLGIVELGEGAWGGSGSVQCGDVDIGWLSWCVDLENPERWWSGGPAVAENWLVLTVDIGQVWSSSISGEENGRLVESFLDLIAHAEASLVTTSYENPPFFWSSASWRDAVAKNWLPVINGENLDRGSSSLRCCGSNGVVLVWVGNIFLSQVKVVLSLRLELVDRGFDVISDGKEGKR